MKFRLIASLGCKVVKKGDLKEEKYQNGGQLQKDLIDAIVAYRDAKPIPVKWTFDGRVKDKDIDEAVSAVMEKFRTSSTFKNGFLKQLNAAGLDIHVPADADDIKDFIDNELPDILKVVLKF